MFTGDKHVMMSSAEDAFIVYASRGRSLVALGDPIGNPASFDELVDDFITLGERHSYRPCFYQIGAGFDTDYLQRTPIARVRHDGRVDAFADVFRGASTGERQAADRTRGCSRSERPARR